LIKENKFKGWKTFRIHPEFEISQIENNSSGENCYVIRSSFYFYLKIGEKEKFLIDRLSEYTNEGQSVGASDLACDYFMEYGELADSYVKSFLYRLWRDGFMQEPYVGIRSRLKKKLKEEQKFQAL
jgi:hypothetical protein